MELLKRFEGHDLEPGTVIIREGEAGQGLFVILLGEVEILNKDPSGREKTVAKLGAGEVFGEMSLLGDRPTTATVRALSRDDDHVPRRATISAAWSPRCRRCASTSRSCPSTAARARAWSSSSCARADFRRPARLRRVMTMRAAVKWLKFFGARRGRAAAGARAGGTAVGRQLQRTDGVPFGRRDELARAATRAAAISYGGGSHLLLPPRLGLGRRIGYGGGIGLLGTLFVLLAVGVGAAMVIARAPGAAARRAGGGMAGLWGSPDDDEAAVVQGRGYLYKLQLALGRSARGIQDRLAEFAAQGRHHQRGRAGGAAAADRRSSSCARRTRSATRPPRGAAR